MLYSYLPIYLLVVGAALCAPERVQNEPEPHQVTPQEPQTEPQDHVGLEKRSPHYNFGLGKRAYSYVSQYKRLPVYNFGLGKRSRPYSFGLGKRSVDDDQADEVISNDIDQAALANLFEQYDDADYEKRARPYSFGLGKRFADDDTSEETRARMFDLENRLPIYLGHEKRARNYNFGLGKRLSSKFSFGLGKRQRDMHRFSFGLGKRSTEDVSADDSENYFES